MGKQMGGEILLSQIDQDHLLDMRQKARLTLAHRAQSTEELVTLIDMLELQPSMDPVVSNA